MGQQQYSKMMKNVTRKKTEALITSLRVVIAENFNHNFLGLLSMIDKINNDQEKWLCKDDVNRQSLRESIQRLLTMVYDNELIKLDWRGMVWDALDGGKNIVFLRKLPLNKLRFMYYDGLNDDNLESALSCGIGSCLVRVGLGAYKICVESATGLKLIDIAAEDIDQELLRKLNLLKHGESGYTLLLGFEIIELIKRHGGGVRDESADGFMRQLRRFIYQVKISYNLYMIYESYYIDNINYSHMRSLYGTLQQLHSSLHESFDEGDVLHRLISPHLMLLHKNLLFAGNVISKSGQFAEKCKAICNREDLLRSVCHLQFLSMVEEVFAALDNNVIYNVHAKENHGVKIKKLMGRELNYNAVISQGFTACKAEMLDLFLIIDSLFLIVVSGAVVDELKVDCSSIVNALGSSFKRKYNKIVTALQGLPELCEAVQSLDTRLRAIKVLDLAPIRGIYPHNNLSLFLLMASEHCSVNPWHSLIIELRDGGKLNGDKVTGLKVADLLLYEKYVEGLEHLSKACCGKVPYGDEAIRSIINIGSYLGHFGIVLGDSIKRAENFIKYQLEAKVAADDLLTDADAAADDDVIELGSRRPCSALFWPLSADSERSAAGTLYDASPPPFGFGS